MPNVDLSPYIILAITIVLLGASLIVMVDAAARRQRDNDAKQQKQLEARREAENRRWLDKQIASAKRAHQSH